MTSGVQIFGSSHLISDRFTQCNLREEHYVLAGIRV